MPDSVRPPYWPCLPYRLSWRLNGLEIGQVLRLDLAAILVPGRHWTWNIVSLRRRHWAAPPIRSTISMQAWPSGCNRDATFASPRSTASDWPIMPGTPSMRSSRSTVSAPACDCRGIRSICIRHTPCRPIAGGKSAARALSRAAEHFRQRGIEQMMAIVEFANWPSLRSHAKLGFRPAGRLL